MINANFSTQRERQRCASRHRSAGLTLVELMVAITLAVFLAGVLAALFIANNRSRQELDRTSNQIESGRYVMDMLGEEIRHAGFFGSTGVKYSAAATLPDPCSYALADIRNGLGYPVTQYAALPASCPTSGYTKVSGTPVLVIRRASTAVTSGASLSLPVNADRYFVQSIPSDAPKVDLGSVGTAGFSQTYDDGSLAPIRAYLVRIFWIGMGASGVPQLMLTEFNPLDTISSTSFVTNPIADGIENIQYVFGLDTAGLDGVADSFTDDPNAIQMRDDLVTVRVDVLARNTAQTAGYADTATYSLGTDVTYTPSGEATKFKRNMFSSEFRINNVLAPRIYCPNASVCI